MISRALIVAALLVAAVPTPVEAGDEAEVVYQAARKSYYRLKGDEKRRRFRHHWLNVASSFQKVAASHPGSPRAPDALFTSAELLRELSRISGQSEDLEAAIADYGTVLERHPSHRLADDSALALARVYSDRLGQPEQALRTLVAGMKRTPDGDMVPEMRALKEALMETVGPDAAAAALGNPLASAFDRALARAGDEGASPPLSGDASGAGEPSSNVDRAPSSKPARQRADDVVADAGSEGGAEDVSDRGAEDTPDPAPDAVSAARGLASRSSGSDVPLSQQLGLKVRRVVIDPGHGGHDSGAVGPGGTREKDIALKISKRLAQILEKKGLEVLFTRDDDRYLALDQRTAFANQRAGDLFVSIHCNAAESSKLSGIATFTLNTSSDRYAIRLAARENASTEKSISDLQFILADLATKANTEDSVRLSELVQRRMVKGLSKKYDGVRDLGTREALFYVLLGAKMPAILVETSFVSNPTEERRLRTAKYQQRVAQSIAEGIFDFLEQRERIAKAP